MMKKPLKKQKTTKPAHKETDNIELTKGVLKNPGKDYLPRFFLFKF